MADEVRVDVSEIHKVAKQLKAIGNKDLRLAMLRGLKEAAEPAKQAARTGAGRLPHRGGLSAKIQASRFTTSVTTGARSANVKIKAGNGYDLRSMDRGRLRHKIFGRGRWVNQDITPGWFSGSIEATAPVVRQRIGQALESIQRELKN